MGYITASGICIACGQLFSFHPNKVPSLNGKPICKDCVDKKINPIRKEKGLAPITYANDAYQSGQNEDEINWGHQP